LSTFAPEKHDIDFSKSIEDLDESEPERTETDPQLMKVDKGKTADKKATMEDKIRRRKQAEAAGLVEPRTVTNVYDGGPFKEPSRMSRIEYIKKHNNLGTIGKIMRSETMRRDEEQFYKTLSEK
jgi:hypothetical protein